jgi:hypothetical protein
MDQQGRPFWWPPLASGTHTAVHNGIPFSIMFHWNILEERSYLAQRSHYCTHLKTSSGLEWQSPTLSFPAVTLSIPILPSLASNLFHIGCLAVIATGSSVSRAEHCLLLYGVALTGRYNKCLTRRTRQFFTSHSPSYATYLWHAHVMSAGHRAPSRDIARGNIARGNTGLSIQVSQVVPLLAICLV